MCPLTCITFQQPHASKGWGGKGVREEGKEEGLVTSRHLQLLHNTCHITPAIPSHCCITPQRPVVFLTPTCCAHGRHCSARSHTCAGCCAALLAPAPPLHLVVSRCWRHTAFCGTGTVACARTSHRPGWRTRCGLAPVGNSGPVLIWQGGCGQRGMWLSGGTTQMVMPSQEKW